MLTDPISDLLTRIRNGYMAKKNKVIVPFSKINDEIVKILSKERVIGNLSYEKNGIKKSIIMELIISGKKVALQDIERISKPGRRVYVKSNKIPKILGGMGNTIVSTPKGLMTGKEAKQKKMGGELICKYW